MDEEKQKVKKMKICLMIEDGLIYVKEMQKKETIMLINLYPV